ncbi:MAG: Ig-like domain repeat protein [Dehalococcoidales bacterium]|nr:Ig-like domain repeat protein [Dehalococcoidales bacterium]
MFRKIFSVMISMIFIFSFVLIPAKPVTAQVPGANLQEMAGNADTIVVGKVINLSSQWNAAHTRISTAVAITVEETIKGAYRNTVNVTVQGGTVDSITEWVSDAPVFYDGERTVVFLKQLTRNTYQVYGQVQGKFTVEDGKVDGMPLAEFKEQVTTLSKGLPVKTTDDIWEPSGQPFKLPDTIQLTTTPIVEDKSATTKAGWTTVMSESFEGTFPPTNWARATSISGSPTWGQTSYTAASGSYSAWCSGTAGSPGTYANNMYAWLVYGPVNLSDATAGTFSFSPWVQTATGDSLRYSASINGNNFYGYTYGGAQSSWQSRNIDLTSWGSLGNLCGQSQVWFAFIFVSDASTTGIGAFVDAVQLQKYTGVKPQVSTISPSQSSAGTNSQITISGSGFGTTHGSVEFFYKSGESFIPGNIISWSDTSIVTTVPVGDVDGYPASASSGPIYVVNSDDIASSPASFTVTFSYGGVKWAGSSPTINYYINPNTPDCDGEEIAVQNAAGTWTAVTGKSFAFHYAGATAVTAAGHNSINEVMWVNLGNVSTLAHAVMWGSGNTFTEVDIEFNDYYSWSTAATPVSGQYDVESLGLHELGHWLCLRDLYGNITGYPQDVNEVMYGFGSSGQAKRTLHTDDIAGIRWIYPILTPSATTIAIASSANPSTFGQSVTFTATVSVVPPATGIPTGAVTFKDGTTTLGTGTVNGSSQATYTTSALSVGSHPISAVYGGDANYAASTSSVLTQIVNQTFTLSVTIVGNGTVTKNPDQETYAENASVTITATRAEGWVFSHWSGDASGTASTVNVTMSSNKSITANFALQGVTLIGAIKQNPTAYQGQTVKISGVYRGWESGYGSPPVTRSDFVVLDETGAIYVTGASSLRYPDDLGNAAQITGTVRLKDGQPYIEIPRQGRY